MFVSLLNKRNLVLFGLGLFAALWLATMEPVKDFVKSMPGTMYALALIHNSLNSPLTPEEVGNGSHAKEIWLKDPAGINQDIDGNIYISDRGGFIWKIDDSGTSRIIAGTGRRGLAHEGKKAVETDLGVPQSIAFDSQGRLHIADSLNNVVLRIESDGKVKRVAGTGFVGKRGDGGPAVKASLDEPYDIKFDSQDNLFIVEFGNNRIRKVDPQGIISTVAGTGEPGYTGDGAEAISANLRGPYGAFVDRKDRLYIADSDNNVIRMVGSDGIINTVVGSQTRGYAGDGGPATDALLDSPQFLVVDDNGTMFIGDEHNLAIRKVSTEGSISTLIGGAVRDNPGENTSGTQEFVLDDPEAMLLQSDGSLLIVDGGNARVIRLLSDGAIEHFAGRVREEPGPGSSPN